MSSTEKHKVDYANSVDAATFSEALMPDIQAEVDLEISLRQKLMQTLESRIEWAQMLQGLIQNANGIASAEIIQEVALEALSVLESPSRHALDQGHIRPPSSTLPRRLPRPPRKALPPHIKSKPSFLYTRANALVNAEGNGRDHLYILKCPECLKTAFTSLQGLLNHARLAHNLEWGTHDECIRACAVVDDNVDINGGVEVGTGPSGILPGLRTIFQMAVGAQNSLKGHSGENQIASNAIEKQIFTVDEDHLNQTLGLHIDSPSLAPFLGKEAMRRQIKVWDEDLPVELGDEDTCQSRETRKRKRPWKMPFAPRNFMENTPSDSSKHADKTSTIQSTPLPLPSIPQSTVSNESRFHFIARIVITDRSLSLPLEQRVDEYKNYTHKWMISVDAPAYTHPITSVLNGLRVTPSDSTISIPTPPETSHPPFVVVGLSDKPFLARVELLFARTSSNLAAPHQRIMFEHWVDLDQLKKRDVVLGQDQVLDVALDKNTVLNPPQFGYTPIDSKSHWTPKINLDKYREAADQVENSKESSSTSSTAKSSTLLNEAAKRFPMFLNLEGIQTQKPDVPYQLVPSLRHFKTLVFGRRKAIEFGRARAIRDDYNQQIENSQPPTLTPLTVADVYSWLSKNGHLPKFTGLDGPRIKEISSVEEEIDSASKRRARQTWCAICGLDRSAHKKNNDVKLECREEEKDTMPNTTIGLHNPVIVSDADCEIVPKLLQIGKLPRLDVQQLMSDGKCPSIARTNSADMDYHSLVSTSDLHLLSPVLDVVDKLALSKFCASAESADVATDGVLYPLDGLGEHRLDVEKKLAPIALLTLLTEYFVRTLVERGLEVANRDKVVSAGMIQKSNRRAATATSHTERLLTPTHILSGVLTRGRDRGDLQDPLDAVVLSCLSKLGVALEADCPVPSRQGEVQTVVKLEEE